MEGPKGMDIFHKIAKEAGSVAEVVAALRKSFEMELAGSFEHLPISNDISEELVSRISERLSHESSPGATREEIVDAAESMIEHEMYDMNAKGLIEHQVLKRSDDIKAAFRRALEADK